MYTAILHGALFEGNGGSPFAVLHNQNNIRLVLCDGKLVNSKSS